ncbi:hypothetical protein TNCV_636111 [Trichonephila clavipes]|nr:hypothetical protein TNCV_636111 [Trichonephila clavipes]
MIFRVAQTVSMATINVVSFDTTELRHASTVEREPSNKTGYKNGKESDESRFCGQHHDGRIRIWRNRGEHESSACSRYRPYGLCT